MKEETLCPTPLPRIRLTERFDNVWHLPDFNDPNPTYQPIQTQRLAFEQSEEGATIFYPFSISMN